MTTIALRPSLFEQLRPEAERLGTNVETLANEWLERRLWQARREKIFAESKRYREMHAELRAKYADKFIAMRDGEVIDHDTALLELCQRIRARYGNEPILITQVTSEPIRRFRIRSPRLRRVMP